MAEILTKDEKSTLKYLYELSDFNTIEHISSVFEELAIYFKKKEVIDCFEYLDRKYPECMLGVQVGIAREIVLNSS